MLHYKCFKANTSVRKVLLLPCQFMCDIELSDVIDSLQFRQINTFVEAEKTQNFLSESSWNLKFISLQKGCVSSSSSNRDVWSKSDRTVTERDWLNSLRIRNQPPLPSVYHRRIFDALLCAQRKGVKIWRDILVSNKIWDFAG